uniref:Uncharacterized protein n=1 Tax=Nelumbo nucifera TaxID=4432 RepID=A0A822Y112_NELNU|nr:TPA_asm: hypothetical protein HUJ06_029072 [Nelumbo nucifera]
MKPQGVEPQNQCVTKQHGFSSKSFKQGPRLLDTQKRKGIELGHILDFYLVIIFLKALVYIKKL